MNFRYLFILGKTPDLSMFELAQFFSENEIVFWDDEFAIVETETEIEADLLKRLGGTISIAEIFDESMEEFLVSKFGEAEGKIPFGISTHGIKDIERKKLLLSAKKALKGEGISCRFVNKDFNNLNAAQVRVEKLLEKGAYLIMVRNSGGREYRGLAIAIQDIDSYSKRDYDKPFRDARMGMLPPKLAQIMVNAGIAGFEKTTRVFDPFCGSGTVLMEAMLAGYDVLGSDISEKCVAGTQKNLEWFAKEFQVDDRQFEVFQHDASKPFEKELDNNICIVTEGYLGPPQSAVPSKDVQKKLFHELIQLYDNFFQNSSKILEKGARICITFPFFNGKEKIFFPGKKGLKRFGFEMVSPEELLYFRRDQVIGREVVVFERV
jgi:tRNA G10  N-methylase Trm11